MKLEGKHRRAKCQEYDEMGPNKHNSLNAVDDLIVVSDGRNPRFALYTVWSQGLSEILLRPRRWGDQDNSVSPNEQHLAIPFHSADDRLVVGVLGRLHYRDRFRYIREDHVHVTIVSVEGPIYHPIAPKLD